MTTDDRDRLTELIDAQREFYDLRAPDFGDATVPDRRGDGLLAAAAIHDLIDELAPTGDVLELACGTGGFTRHLLLHARTVTAVDASPRMLERNRREVADDRVTYVEADLFEWQPARRYDVVFFGFWLSHVPMSRFDDFWDRVRSALRDGGRVGFVDEDDRGAVNDDLRVVDDVPVARRTLRDGRQFDVVKLFWDPAELDARLRSIGWDVAVRRVGDTFLYGSGTP